MKNNYERYSGWDFRKMNKKGCSYYIYRRGPDKTIMPLVNSIQGKKVLEVGLGGGYYTAHFLRNGCGVTGVDVNPHLGSHLGIEIIKAPADDFSRLLGKRTFDVAASFWMTEYLDPAALKAYIAESLKVLHEGGLFITTIPRNRGLGNLHVLASGLKHIKKFCFSEGDFLPWLAGTHVSVTTLRGLFGLPYAHFVVVKK